MQGMKRLWMRLWQYLPFSKATSHPYIPAHQAVDAVAMAQSLVKQGYRVSLHYLGKASKDGPDILDNIAHLNQVLEYLDDENLDLCLSLSPDLVGYNRSEKTGSNKALQLARNFRNRVQARDVQGRQLQRASDLTGETLDMAALAHRPLLSIHAAPTVPMQYVLALSARLMRAGVPVCQTLPAALQRSLDDAKVLISQGGHVRLAFYPKDVRDAHSFHDPDLVMDNYTAIAALLLSEDALIQQIRPIFVLDDDSLADHIIQLSELQGWDQGHFEFEIPYGVNVDLKRRLRDQGYSVRILLPFGLQWDPYLSSLES